MITPHGGLRTDGIHVIAQSKIRAAILEKKNYKLLNICYGVWVFHIYYIYVFTKKQ